METAEKETAQQISGLACVWNRKRQDVNNMEFLKHKWGYLLLAVMILLTAAAVWYLLFLKQGGNSYAGGMLVQAAHNMKEWVS